MSYIINLTNGQSLKILSDGTTDNDSTSLTLIGKNYAGYGEFLNENFVHLLENFASEGEPNAPLKGQLWWNTTDKILKVYTGSAWKISTGATAAPFNSPPGDRSSLGGDLWFDTTNQQLKVWNGETFVRIGPVETPVTGDTGSFPAVMTDTLGGSHVVTQIKIAGVPYVIISKDTFSSALAGFGIVKAGINFSTIASPTMVLSTQDVNATPGTLVQRDTLAGISAASVTGTIFTATNLMQAPSFVGTFSGNIAGNVLASSVTASTIITNGVSSSGGYTGTLLTASQPNVTQLGTLTSLNVNGAVAITAPSATLNGAPIATIGGSVSFTSINNTPIGNLTPSTGAFTTLGGTLTTASQPNITSASSLATVGNITSGTWSAGVVQPQYGGTGVNNGTRTLTLTGANYTLNQSVASGASPTFAGTNFTSIPNGALVNSALTVTAGTGLSGGGSVSLGGSITLNNAGVTGIVAGTGINVSSGTGSVTISTPQNLSSGSSVQFASLGVGTAASGTTGEIRATNNITAYFSDDRLKTRLGRIENALDKLCSLEGFYYEANETAQDLGYKPVREMGLSAQSTQLVAPEIVKPAPIDEKYLTIQYERFAPLIVEAIKELRDEVSALKAKIK